jgi:polar amino acid transport system substrate-binding protein
VDAILQDLPVNLEHTKDGKYEIVEEYSTDEQYGFAFKKAGSEELVEAVNEELQALRDSGKYQEIYDKYFKVS